ncbi:hypothetical protein BpHYR1_031038 [Brachionus plicatilis]|uniref:Uncharacterized protein n=1 Tax=Brachionus plicatilis TaxID=10195 RepID=A0A3M7PSE1_BRAPC|nr:hypothetical protein BpHYR1_031038 [Brachionus plicatilis]
MKIIPFMVSDNMVCYNIDANYDYFDYQNHDVLDSEDSEKKIFFKRFRYDNKRKKKHANRVVYKDILKAIFTNVIEKYSPENLKKSKVSSVDLKLNNNLMRKNSLKYFGKENIDKEETAD